MVPTTKGSRVSIVTLSFRHSAWAGQPAQRYLSLRWAGIPTAPAILLPLPDQANLAVDGVHELDSALRDDRIVF
jgi:hypothetical protein